MISDKAIILKPCYIGNNVSIGPYSLIGPNVKIGDNNWIDSFVKIYPNCIIGNNNKIFKFSVIGFKNFFNFSFKKNYVNNLKRFTLIGNNNYISYSCYIAENCVFLNNIKIFNNVFVADNVFIDNFTTLCDFVNVNRNIFIGSYSYISRSINIYENIFPYSFLDNNNLKYKKLNFIILKRKFFNRFTVIRLKNIYKLLLQNIFCNKELTSLLLSDKYFSFESNNLVNFFNFKNK